MRLELGRQSDYAIRAAVALGRHHAAGVRRKAREIAEEMDIPATNVSHVLADLVRAGLAVSTAGRSGGYRLARPPDQVSLLAIIRAAGDDPTSQVCVLRGGPCRLEDACGVHVFWFQAQQAMLGRLGETTVADILTADPVLEPGAAARAPVELGA
jgi:Rrf2 family transcriptional regulator, iron-sulfur cluster assembly transcription factor